MADTKILIVEDKKSVAERVETRLKKLGYTVCAVVPTGAQGVEKAAEMHPDLVFIDIELEGKTDGIEAAKRIRNSLDIPTVYLADYPNPVFLTKEDLLKQAEITNPFEYLPFPYGERKLYLVIESVLYKKESEANKQHLTKIANGISDAAIATDRKGLITFMNPMAEILTGWEMEQASGKLVTDILDLYVKNGENLIKHKPLIEMLQRGTIPIGALSFTSEVDYDTYLITKCGREIPIDYNITPIKDEEENLAGTVITVRDIAKYKTIQEQSNQTINELRQQTDLMKTVFDSMSDGIVVLSLAGDVLFVNPSIQKMFGTTPLEPVSSKWSETHGVFYPDKKTLFPVDHLLSTYIFQGEVIRDRELFVHNNEQTEGIHVKASVLPLFDENQKVVACVAIVRDITQDKIAALPTDIRPKDLTDNRFIHPFDEIVGNSENIQQMFALMERAAEGDISVLISGESGAGKELVARAIHANSPRSEGPFITVNCAAIPETLIESELFGHEQGAFTGARTKRIGKFEQANQGTIFFDEIGDMQWVLQAKLLRVLQERQIQRVGGTANIPIDIRVLTATNQDLEAGVEVGTFRRDLFYRIAAFPIQVPPLRDRREDIPLLANHFLKKYAVSRKKPVKAISADALHLLMQYHFPGNVRELENIIARAVLLETTELLQPSNLPPQISPMRSSQPILFDLKLPVILPFEEVERQVLAHALKLMDNNVTNAAQALKMARSTLYRKLKLHQLPIAD